MMKVAVRDDGVENPADNLPALILPACLDIAVAQGPLQVPYPRSGAMAVPTVARPMR